MAAGVNVQITDHTVISGLNTPGGVAYEWREAVLADLKSEFRVNPSVPEGDPRNRTHDRGTGGNYMNQQWFDRRGSSGHHVVARMGNNAFYADLVEFGRGSTYQFSIGPRQDTGRGVSRETFGWSKHTPPGSIERHTFGTKGYDGMHSQRDVVNAVMPRHASGYTFLP